MQSISSPPETRYAYNGDFALAYQVFGEGPDLIYLPGWVMNVEANWLAPDHARFLGRLASFSRLIVIDRRNNGCSDRLSPGEASTIDDELEGSADRCQIGPRGAGRPVRRPGRRVPRDRRGCSEPRTGTEH